ncbi:MAG TPA: helix-turn-helix domain-containing protein [Polyangiaceae bacterium]|nr:helix-turn-helix domain-containing protein [Polyangiaceae bacterium]
MPQVLKPEIRARILSAGLEVFAEQGYLGATMNAIAERAGLGAASLYRYFPSKTELFEAAIPPELAARFEQLIEQRVSALAELPAGAPFKPNHDYGAQMLDFWLEHRLAVVVLLDRAHGSAYESYGERFVGLLFEKTLEQIRGSGSNVRITAAARLVLTRIFESTRSTLASILAHSDDPRAIRQGIEAFWSYQIPGLQGFARWARKG